MTRTASPGRLLGYARVSTEEQATDAQIDELSRAGCGAIFQEHGSGASRARPELARLLKEIRPGDVLHGKGAHNRFFRERLDVSRLLLAAISLGFDHPFTRARVTIEAPPGLEFSRVLTAFGWRAPAAEPLPRDPA